ncbi:MAG: hypothetical protein WKF75_21555 [Singulisphaera sp.]
MTFEVPVPGRVSYRSESVVGYWIKDDSFDVLSVGPLVVEVRGVPAGAIIGRALEPDGTPAVGGEPERLDGREAAEPERRVDPGEQHPRRRPCDSSSARCRSAAPMSWSHLRVITGRSASRSGSTARRRLRRRVAAATPVAAEGRVVGPDGRPVGRPGLGSSWTTRGPAELEPADAHRSRRPVPVR